VGEFLGKTCLFSFFVASNSFKGLSRKQLVKLLHEKRVTAVANAAQSRCLRAEQAKALRQYVFPFCKTCRIAVATVHTNQSLGGHSQMLNDLEGIFDVNRVRKTHEFRTLEICPTQPEISITLQAAPP
jgi:hypothetical protein